MIEVGSFIGMAAMCGAGIRIKDVSVKDLGIIPDAFRRLGVKVKVEGDDLFIPEQKHYVIDSFIDGTIMTLGKCTMARTYARPPVGAPRGGNPGSRKCAFPSEDVREPSLLRG